MELTDLNIKVLALNTLLDNFREDGQNTEDSDTVLAFFQNAWGHGGYDITLIQVSNVLDALAERLFVAARLYMRKISNGPLHTLHNLLVDLENETPGAFIDLEG